MQGADIVMEDELEMVWACAGEEECQVGGKEEDLRGGSCSDGDESRPHAVAEATKRRKTR